MREREWSFSEKLPTVNLEANHLHILVDNYAISEFIKQPVSKITKVKISSAGYPHMDTDVGGSINAHLLSSTRWSLALK